MNSNHEKMINILADLAQNHCVSGIKAEFETEGASFDEAKKLKILADENNLDFVIKIGGCGAIKDLSDAQKIGADKIVAPMIESPYAVEKFIKSIDNIYKTKDIEAFINIETKNGVQYLDEILNLKSMDKISGIVAGRGDMAGSLGYGCNMVNSDEIFHMVDFISKKCKEYNKKLIIGGGITLSSIPFLKKIQDFSAFETRKIIFDKKALDNNIEDGILKAIEFEILWIKSKKEPLNTDIQRLSILEKRLALIRL